MKIHSLFTRLRADGKCHIPQNILQQNGVGAEGAGDLF